MTDADKIARLEAELEAARRDADDERSTREALDAKMAELRQERDDLRALILCGTQPLLPPWASPEEKRRMVEAWYAVFREVPS